MNFLVFFCSMLMLLSGCVSNGPDYAKGIEVDDLYFDYTIVGDEESNNVTVKIQYRIGGPGGKPWLIPDPGKVEFDGERMPADSSRRNGFWYEVNKPLDEFEGEHQIVLTKNGKTYKQVFDYDLMPLKTEVPRIVYRNDLVLEFDGLSTGDQVRVLLTDTGYYTRGIDRIDTVKDGRIVISRHDLDNVRNGPVTIEFYRETEQELTEAPERGGRLVTGFGLRREFELKDSTRRPSAAGNNGR